MLRVPLSIWSISFSIALQHTIFYIGTFIYFSSVVLFRGFPVYPVHHFQFKIKYKMRVSIMLSEQVERLKNISQINVYVSPEESSINV